MTRDDRHTGVFGEPLRQACGAAIGQQIDGLTAFEVDQEGAVGAALPQAPVIDAHYARWRGRWAIGGPDRPPQGVPAHRDAQRAQEARAWEPADGHTDDQHDRRQPRRPSAVGAATVGSRAVNTRRGQCGVS